MFNQRVLVSRETAEAVVVPALLFRVTEQYHSSELSAYVII